MDLVTRDEFEAVKAMAAKARAEQEDLARRVAELEGLVAAMRKPEHRRAPPGIRSVVISISNPFCRAAQRSAR